MWIEPAGLSLFGDLLAPGVDELGQQLDGRSVAPFGRLLHRGLEIAPEHERDLGAEQLVELVGVQLEVVGFGPDGREVRDADARPAHPLRRERHWVERGHHVDLAARRGRRFDAQRGRDGRGATTTARTEINHLGIMRMSLITLGPRMGIDLR